MCMGTMSTGAWQSRNTEFPWIWNYRQVRVAQNGTKLGPLKELYVLLTFVPSLQPL